MPLSARDPESLAGLVTSLRERLREDPALSAADVATTLALGRPHREHRAAAVGRTAEQLAEDLGRTAAATDRLGPLAFAYAGQGGGRPGQAREIYAARPEARRVIDLCERVHADEFGGSLLPLLLGEDPGERVGPGEPGEPDRAWPTDIAQPALFAHRMALTEVWRGFGVRPDLVLGHSVGEYAALCAAGALPVEDGLRLTALRGRLMREMCPPGGMLAVRADTATARRVARAAGAELAAVNGPRAQVIAGPEEALREAARLLDLEGTRWRALPVDRAFHTSALDPLLAELRAIAEKFTPRPLLIPFAGGLDGELRPAGSTVDAEYLVRQAREPVRFDLAVATAFREGCADFLALDTGAGLAGLGRHCLPDSRWLPGQGGEADRMSGLLTSLGELYRAGADIDWETVAGGGGRVPLPGHPMRRRRFPARPAGAAVSPEAAPSPVPEAASASPASADVIEEIRALVRQKLGVESSDVTPDTSFFELGADSLVLMALTAALEAAHGVRVPVRELFSEADTPRRLAEHIARLTGPPASQADTPAQAPVQARTPARTPVQAQAPAPALTPPPAPTAVGASGEGDGLHAVLRHQIAMTEQLVESVTGLLSRQLDLLSGTPAPPAPPAPPSPPPAGAPSPAAVRPVPERSAERRPRPLASPARPAAGCDVSLYFFGDYPDDGQQDKYALILEAGEFADRHGFHSLWFPERHFDSFGALFPNPSVLAAALATRTSRVRLQAGSVVLPLHHPVRVAEEWSVVDNLSGGRVGLCFASGWHARDFALAPENYGRHRELMYEQMETVRSLWSGEPVSVTAGDGQATDIRLHPRPLQARPPLYVAVVGNPDSYRRAAAHDLGIVTNLMAQTVEQLAENIALYRRTRGENGLDPDAGRVVVLVHTYLGDDAERVRAEAYQPFVSYLRSSLSLFNQVTNSLGVDVDLDNTPEEDVEFLLGRAYERYCASRALIGDVPAAVDTVRLLREAGADEIACFVDFGVPAGKVLAALPAADRLRRLVQEAPEVPEAPLTPVAPTAPEAEAPAPEPARAVGRPLSAAQRRIWFLERLHPGTRMYHEPKAIRLEGPLNLPALRWALERVAARQPALRTVFRDRDGVPYQEVREEARLDCPVEDHTGSTEEEALRSALETAGGHLFDLDEGPLVSARLLRLSDERHLLFLLAHHLVFDSSSTVVFTRDLAALYRSWPDGDPGLPPVPTGPAAPVDPVRKAEALAYWRRRLDGVGALDLPTDRPRPPVRSGAGAALTVELDGELTTGLRRYCAERRATLFMALTAAIGATLGRFSGQRDVVVGTAVADRPADAADAVGLFLDTVALRLDLDGDPDFATLLNGVRDRATTAYEHLGVPFDELVGALNPLRDPGRNPLFQVLVEYENESQVEFDPPRLAATLLDVPSARAPFDLSFYLTHHAAGVRVMVEYDTALFDESTVRRFVAYIERVLRRALASPAAPLSALTALTDGDRAELSRMGRLDEPAPPVAGTLHGMFELQARATPDAVALLADGVRLTYREVDERADRLAHRLRARGAGRGERVAVFLPRGPELIVALLAVLKSGAAYVPIDASVPAARLHHLLDDAGPVLLLTYPPLLDAHPALARRPVHLVETGDGPESGPGDVMPPVDGPPPDVRPEDPAYCVYTSGSTGRPKGVVVPHRGPANLVRQHVERHPALRTLQWTSHAFDVSVQEIFTTLAAGAALVLIGDEVRKDPAAVAETVRRHGVQRVFMPAIPLTYLVETGPELPSLREVFSAGDVLKLTPAFGRFLAAHPRCALYNQYGPTEASVIVTSHRVDPAGEEHPPIGTPIDGVRIHLRDARGVEVPVGVVGEIHVSGTAVAHGYHALPEETAAAFRAEGGGMSYRTGDLARWRPDGTLAFVGRVDDQVKIRGHRVEPAEVRAALTRMPGTRDVAVVSRRDHRGEVELVAYVETPGAGAADALGRLREALAAELPAPMVPRHWVALDRLPVNAAGKLDRSRLPDPEVTREPTDAPVEPASALERELHALWCSELNTGAVSVTRSFFALGGHSLGAVRLLHRMAEEHGVELSMARFFRAPTIRAVAGRFEPGPDAPVDAEVPMPATLRRLWRRHHELADFAVYNVAHRIDIRGALDTEALTHALRELVRRHDALRSRAAHRNGELTVEILAEVPPRLPVTDLTREDEAGVEGWCRSVASEPFAMDRAPLFRFALGRLSGERWVLVVVLHHAVCDGWSLGVIWHELAELYNAGPGSRLAPPAAQFTDYARWERRRLTDRDGRAALEAFWREELDGAPLRLALPCDRPRPDVLSGRGALHERVVDGAVMRHVAETAAGLGTTPYTVLAAAFAVWAARLCDTSSDVVLAASSANRLRSGHEAVVGLLGDAVLLRARLSGAATFTELVTRLGETLFEALDHQALPLTDIVRLVSPQDADRPFPTVLFTVVTTPPPRLDLRGLTTAVRGLHTPGGARNELYVVLTPAEDGITVNVEYATDLFDAATIARWSEEFAALLARLAEAPRTPLAEGGNA
nr:non-ribosomal peptide synthetase [Streptomyces sp. SBT349]